MNLKNNDPPRIIPVHMWNLKRVAPFVTPQELSKIYHFLHFDTYFAAVAADEYDHALGFVSCRPDKSGALSISCLRFHASPEKIPGIGTALLRHIIDRAAPKGFTGFIISYTDKNKYLLDLCRSFPGKEEIKLIHFYIDKRESFLRMLKKKSETQQEYLIEPLGNYADSLGAEEIAAYRQREKEDDKEQNILEVDEGFYAPLLPDDAARRYSFIVRLNGVPAGWIIAHPRDENELYLKVAYTEKEYRRTPILKLLLEQLIYCAMNENRSLHWLALRWSRVIGLCTRQQKELGIDRVRYEFFKTFPFDSFADNHTKEATT